MRKNIKKTAAAVAAVLSAGFLVLGSTLAWQSTRQLAENQKYVTTNPGARLHDDYNGTDVKRVFVENFGENDVAVRVQIREFLEYGPDAGKETGEKRVAVDIGARYKDPNNWPIHIPSDNEDVTKCANKFHDYVTYTFGGITKYLPTFNMNKDSLAADINGTYEAQFKDYKDYNTATDAVTQDEVWDADNNTDDEGNGAQGGKGGVENTNYKLVKNQSHQIASTLGQQDDKVISMAKWMESEATGGKGSKPGNYWVYDTDGWAYWANPLSKKTATSLLMNAAKLSNKPDDDYFFTINVIAQAASLGDLGEFYEDGFWDPVKGTAPTANAQKLLKAIGGTSVPLSLKDQIRQAIQNPDNLDANLTVTIDGDEYYVVSVTKDQSKALLLKRNYVQNDLLMKFRADYGKDTKYWQWERSDVRAYLNGEWLAAHPTVARVAELTEIKTRETASGSTYATTKDQVFCLTEADINGTNNGSTSNVAADYTLGEVQKVMIPVDKTQSSSGYYYWGRSPYSSNNVVIAYSASGGNSWSWNTPNTAGYYVRPAFIVDISEPAPEAETESPARPLN